MNVSDDQQMIDKYIFPYKKVTFFQGIVDRFSGLKDAVFAYHRIRDPFKAYCECLQKRIDGYTATVKCDLERKNSIIKTNNIDFKDLSTEKLNKRLASIEASVKAKTEELNNIEKEPIAGEKDFYNEYESVLKTYKNWYKALGRPSYEEYFDYKVFLQGKKLSSSETTQKIEDAGKKGLFSKLFKNIARWIKALLSFLIVLIIAPFEIKFALPAFEMLTPDKPSAAFAGALIFVGVLGLIGALSGHILVRMRINRVAPVTDGADGEFKVTTEINKFYAFIFCFIFFVSIFLTYTGASLRAIVPEATTLRESVDRLYSDRKKIQNQIIDDVFSTDAAAVVKLKSQRDEIDKKIKEYSDARDDLRKKFFTLSTTDGLVAMGIYLVIVLAPSLTYIIRKDPYFEYGLVADRLNLLYSLKVDFENIHLIQNKLVQIQINSLKNELAQIDKELLSRTSDEHMLGEIKKFVENVLDALARNAHAWKIERIQVYAKYYAIIRSSHIESAYQEYQKSLKCEE